MQKSAKNKFSSMKRAIFYNPQNQKVQLNPKIKGHPKGKKSIAKD